MTAVPSPPRRRTRTIVAILVLAGFIALGFAAFLLPPDTGAHIAAWLDRVNDAPWAPPAALLAFVVLANLGVPQFVLISALVAAFGPWAGFFYSWIGKMISCAIGFFIGRRFGAGVIARRAGPQTAHLMNEFARHGFWASLLIRMAPTVPSVVINVAAGCTPMRFRDFIAGTAIGSVPKMALIAFAGHSAISGLAGAGAHAWISLAGAVALMVVLALIARRWMKQRLSEAPKD